MSVIEEILNLFPEERNKIEEMFNWDKVEWYYNFLIINNEKGGFFSKRDSTLILNRHLSESLYHIYFIKKLISVSHETEICDVGSGPGLPGFLFYCLKDVPTISLLDSQARRLKILEFELISSEFFTNKIHFIYKRAEENKNKYNLVVSRSFVPYPFSVEVCTNLVKNAGYYIPFIGGSDAHTDIELSILEKNGLMLKDTLELKKLSFLGKRHIKILKKTGSPLRGYPRPWKILIKEIQKENG